MMDADADADADADVDASPIDPTAILDADSSTSASHTGATLGVPAAEPRADIRAAVAKARAALARWDETVQEVRS